MSVKTVSAGLWSVIICALILVGATGCKDDTIYKVAEPGSISPGDAVPAPTNEVVLIVSGEISVTNKGNAHYLFHGQAYRSDLASPGPMQPFDGNAEIDATDPADIRVIAMITKTEIRPVHNGNPRTLEIYSGQIDLDYETLDGWAEGIIYICEDPQTPSETPTCKFITTGQISMTKVDCP